MQRSLRFSPRNLQHEFSSHASDFGVSGNWNKANADLFRQAIESHIAAASVIIAGTFRGATVVTHYYDPTTRYYDPTTRLWAAFDQTNTFVAGWKLYRTQIANLLNKGDVK